MAKSVGDGACLIWHLKDDHEITLDVMGSVFFFNLVNDQLDAQFFYFIIRLLESYTCFEQRRAHHQEVKLY